MVSFSENWYPPTDFCWGALRWIPSKALLKNLRCGMRFMFWKLALRYMLPRSTKSNAWPISATSLVDPLTWIFDGSPCDAIRDAMFTVSPNLKEPFCYISEGLLVSAWVFTSNIEVSSGQQLPSHKVLQKYMAVLNIEAGYPRLFVEKTTGFCKYDTD